MKIVFGFIFSSFFLFTPVMAQKWMPCKITMVANDTLQGAGYIKNDTLHFKQANSAVPIEYTGDKVNYILIDGKKFKSSQLVSSGLKPIAFFEILMDGDLQLYYKGSTSNKEKPSFFISKDQGPVIELTRTIKEVVKDGNTYNLYYDAYRNQLKDLFRDCSNFSMDDRKNYFTPDKMIDLAQKYVHCKGKKNSFIKTYHRISDVYLVGGLDISNVSFSSPTQLANAFYYLNGKSATSNQPFFGIQWVAGGKEYAFLGELLYKRTSLSSINYNLDYLKMNAGVKVTDSKNPKFALDFQAGASFNYILNSNASDGFAYKRVELGVFFGAGITFNKIGLFFRDEVSNGFSPYVTVSTKTNYLYFGLKYKISK